MPIYEYHCNACGREFEELVMGKDAAVQCPACGSAKTEKLMSRCRARVGGGGGEGGYSAPSSSGGGCSGCSGGNCSTCH